MEYEEYHGIRATSAVDAFVIAASNTRLPEMKQFLADGVPVDGVASYSGDAALHAAAGAGLVRSVAFLLAAGADRGARNRMDLTPLMVACALGKTKGTRVALLLIEAGADVRAMRAADGMTALKFAAHAGPPALIDALIDGGADVDGPPGTDLTALMIAARSGNVPAIEALARRGADPSRPCLLPWAERRTAEGLAELEGRRAARAALRRLRLAGARAPEEVHDDA